MSSCGAPQRLPQTCPGSRRPEIRVTGPVLGRNGRKEWNHQDWLRLSSWVERSWGASPGLLLDRCGTHLVGPSPAGQGD